MAGTAPIFIVTAELDPASFHRLNELRRRHFPADRNFLDAHLTLFHRLDPEGIDILTRAIPTETTAPVALHFSGLRKLGRGVAVSVTAPGLQQLRSLFVVALAGRLSRQDAQGFNPHVTIQNKVDPTAATALHAALAGDFVPWQGTSPAIQVWEYLGGPWRFVERRPFTGGCDPA